MARGELTVSVLFYVFVVVVFTKECVGRAYSFVFVVLPLNVSVELTRIPVLPLNITVKLTRSYFWFYHRMCQ